MLDNTAGPPRKPVLAATNNKPASNASTTASRRSLSHWLPMPMLSMIRRNVVALRVSPSTWRASHNRYSRKMPPAVNASDRAMYNMVILPVRTRGSASMLTLLETASSPV